MAKNRKKKSNNKRRREFSKALLIQESILLWVVTLAFVCLAFICIYNQYTGELPWLTAMAAFPWTAYGVSQAFYYKKSAAENTKGGIKYESMLQNITEVVDNPTEEDNENNNSSTVG